MAEIVNMSEPKRVSTLDANAIAQCVENARRVTLSLVDDLTDEQLELPYLPTVNPVRWELGHIGFFYDCFLLAELDGVPTVFEGGNDLFNSFEVDHADRWSFDMIRRSGVLDYLGQIKQRVLDRLAGHEPDARELYHYQLAVHHESMHAEAFTWTRQTMGYAAPSLGIRVDAAGTGDRDLAVIGDARIEGGTFSLGARRGQGFVFDNEKWEHPVEVAPFSISKTAVTNAEFLDFVDAGGYRARELWSSPGWVWREKAAAEHPLYWKCEDGAWSERFFDGWGPLRERAPVVHVGWYEAEAYCTWARRRLPSEAEWECAASTAPNVPGKRLFPWGDDLDSLAANLGFNSCGAVDVDAYPQGDSGWGCRQMLGNVWEWTASAFYPYPGFVVDTPYREYSAPWFGYPKVLKGGAWATSPNLVTNTHRNFFEPNRRDVFAGFRTCARDEAVR